MLEAGVKIKQLKFTTSKSKESRQTERSPSNGQANRCRRKPQAYTREYDNPRQYEQRRKTPKYKERRKGHMKDALALGGEEGRDKLR